MPGRCPSSVRTGGSGQIDVGNHILIIFPVSSFLRPLIALHFGMGEGAENDCQMAALVRIGNSLGRDCIRQKVESRKQTCHPGLKRSPVGLVG